VSICERKKELKRRRHRSKKLVQLQRKLKTATVSERAVITEKIRSLTPGAEDVLGRLELDKR
jgi:hypothetical protein